MPGPTSPPPPSIVVSSGLVSKVLRSFPSDSAPGPSLLRANHLKEAALCPSAACGARSLQAITKAVNLLADGRVPEEVASHLCGATLLAVKKKNGGLRPIVVCEMLWRLTSKCLSRSVLSDAIDIFAPCKWGLVLRPVVK